jgi:hypothetical protein
MQSGKHTLLHMCESSNSNSGRNTPSNLLSEIYFGALSHSTETLGPYCNNNELAKPKLLQTTLVCPSDKKYNFFIFLPTCKLNRRYSETITPEAFYFPEYKSRGGGGDCMFSKQREGSVR